MDKGYTWMGIILFCSIAAPAAHAGRHHRRCEVLTQRYHHSLSGRRLPLLPQPESVNLDVIPRPIPGVRDSIVAAIMQDERVLMNQRGGEVGYGHWGVLGGKVDPGETLRQGLIRELDEEAYIFEIANARVVHVHYHYDHRELPDGQVIKQMYRVFVVRANLPEHVRPAIREQDKILRLEWFPLSDMPAPLFSQFDEYKEQLYPANY